MSCHSMNASASDNGHGQLCCNVVVGDGRRSELTSKEKGVD